MALTVQKPKPQPKLVVVNNYGMQGSTYNPQPAASGTVVQNTAPAKKFQPAAPVQTVQPAATAAQVQAAAEAARVAAAAEASRQREALRVQVQGQVNNKVAANTQAFKLQVTQAITPRVTLAKPQKQPKIDVPDYRTPFEKERDKAYLDALREVDKQRQPGDKKGLSKLWDKVSFGQDRRDAGARGYAEKRLQEITSKKISEYDKRLKSFLSEQAKRKAKIEGTKFDSQAAFDRAVAEYTTWESAQIGEFEGTRAQLTGFTEGLKKASSKPLTSAAAKFAGGFHNVVAKPAEAVAGKIWQYTLGSGDKNVPSLVSAPSRLINFFGNLNTPGRTVYKEGGTSQKLTPGIKNAWTASQDQRSFNLKPWTDLNWRTPQAHKMFDDQVQSLINARKQINPNRKPDDPDKILKGFVDSYNFDHRGMNTGLDLAADPLNIAGGIGAAAKAAGWSGKLAKAAKATSFVSKITSAVEKVKATKAVSWLTAEAKLPHQQLGDALDAAKLAQGKVQKDLLPRINELNKTLAGHAKLDTTVLEDIGKLTDSEAAVLQRMVDGKVAGLDRLKFVDVRGLRGGGAAARSKLEDIARRWTDLTEQMKAADEVLNTRFGKGKKFYAPNTTWINRKDADPLSKYNFLKRRGKKLLKADELQQGAIDRYFVSNLDETFAAKEGAKRVAYTAERKKLLDQYDTTLEPHRRAVAEADRKTRTPYGRTRTFLAKHGPTALWKKSVLKYRPAWYVNNFLYNTQAAALSGGGRALVEQARLLRPRNFKRALAEVPAEVRTKLANEIGKGRLAKFGNNVENLSRVAAYRALKKKGFTDEAALKRVNRYLFDYSTKNWERPLRAAVPFWSFQKNLGKAAIQMPFDRPIAAQAYNKLDDYQQQQFDTDFDKVVPRLRELGYTDAEIEQMRQEQAKYYRGRLKVGGKYITTPFNAFSEKGLSNVGVNPYLSAFGEVATATDSFGRPTSGREAGFGARFTSKFPQAQIAKEGINKFLISTGRRKPTSSWIGAPGSEGYGLTKQAQGYDAKKPNYQAALDPGAKFAQDLAAFLGQPRGLKFDTTKFLERKTMQKLKTEYFAVDWKSLDFPAAEKKRNELFKKYGVTSDKFYKGELSKYDTEDTKRIKGMKEDAAKKTQALFAEYSRQPKGTRNVWATQKLKELVDSGYFDKNPFLKSFDWTNPATISKAYRKIAYDTAKRTGNWSDYEKTYGVTPGRQKFLDYQAAKKSGNFASYNAKYGKSDKAQKAEFWQKYYATSDTSTRRQLLRENPQYAKNGVKDEAVVAAAQFWEKYYQTEPADRKKLLAENPQYNTRSNWTPEMWLAWRASQKTELRGKLATVGGFTEQLAANAASARSKAAPVLLKKQRSKTKKLVFSTA